LTKKVKDLDVEELYTKISEALTGFTAFVNSPDLSKSVQTLYLAMEDVRGLIQNIDNRIDPIAVGLEDTIRDTQHLVRRIDSKIDPLQKELSEVDRDIQQLITVIQSRVKRLAASMEKTNKSAVAALSQAEKTLKTVEGVTKEDSPVLYELTRTLQQLSAAARSIRVWADYLERHPEALLRGKGGNTRR
jgi:paraquat-inducible protein B